MPLGIGHTGATINFVNGAAEKWVLKQHIKTVSIIQPDTIKIELTDSVRAIVFRHEDVFIPVTSTARELVLKINQFIGLCTCREEVLEEYLDQ